MLSLDDDLDAIALEAKKTLELILFVPANDIDKGHLHFMLHGERMKGEWLLIRLKPRGKEMSENWLLRKLDDTVADGNDELTERELPSVKTGRTMQEIAEGKRMKKRSAKRAR